MKTHPYQLLVISLLPLLSQSTKPHLHLQLSDLASSITQKSRRVLNLSNIFGSQTSLPAYERISSQPVFAVTTSWGSPYLLFEKRDRTESNLEFDEPSSTSSNTDSDESSSTLTDADEKLKQESRTHQVALYFCDEEDALRLRDEMLQMDQMKGADMRITSFSLAKAIRQASNLHKGLLTGQPINEINGKMKSPNEGGVLRYKIVPPKRELFYAARCKGRERVGLFADNAEEDARLMMASFPVIGGNLAIRRKRAVEKRRRRVRAAAVKSKSADSANSAVAGADDEEDPIRTEYAHMEGFVGIPVFYSPSLKKFNTIKSILRGNSKTKQSPLFFSYQDLIDSWSDVRSKAIEKSKKGGDNAIIAIPPETPNDVEVYNLMDVITSMDKQQWHKERSRQMKIDSWLSKIPIVNQVVSNNEFGVVGTTTTAGDHNDNYDDGLGQVVFIPNSKNTKFKEMISKVGNGKARGLRPMRPWGRDAM